MTSTAEHVAAHTLAAALYDCVGDTERAQDHRDLAAFVERKAALDAAIDETERDLQGSWPVTTEPRDTT